MAEVLRLREAARLIGVSPGRLYRAIADGRRAAAPGGGPGKPTLVSLEALHTFCQSEGLHVPDESGRLERSKRPEHSIRAERDTRPVDEALVQHVIEAMAGRYVAQVIERQREYFEALLKEELAHLVNRALEHIVDHVVVRLSECLDHSPRPECSTPSECSERSAPATSDPKAAVLPRLQEMRATGLSLQAMADRLNAEGIPTSSGDRHWQKGTIGKLLAQGKATGR
jgi:hypothetical protein